MLVLLPVEFVAVALLVLPAPLSPTKELDLLELLLLAPGLFASEFKVLKLLLFPTVFKGPGAAESKVGIAISLLLAVKTKSTFAIAGTGKFDECKCMLLNRAKQLLLTSD